MKLDSAIREILRKTPDKIIKIGAKKGSGFFFVGTAKEYMEYINALNVAVKKQTEQALISVRGRLKAVSAKMKFEAFVAFQLDAVARYGAELDLSDRAYKDYIERQKKALYRTQSALEKNLKRKKEYKHPGERDVVDVLEADPVVDDAIIIYVNGFETGKYWTTDERMKTNPESPVGVGTINEKGEENE